MLTKSPSFELGAPWYIDFYRVRSESDLTAELSRIFGEDIADLGTSVAAYDGPPVLLVFLNLHGASDILLRYILRSLLDTTAGSGPNNCKVLFEGSIDVDWWIDSVFPLGNVRRPHVALVESSSPWRRVAEVEELCALAGRNERWLVPWVADVTGGDTGFVSELLERLPGAAKLTSASLETVLHSVMDRSPPTLEIRAVVAPFVGTDVLRLLMEGRVVRGLPPETSESLVLRTLFYAGVASYDEELGGYIVRGPITAAAAASSSKSDGLLSERHAVTLRCASALALVASAELQLRRRLSGLDVASHAKEMRLDAAAATSKRVREALISSSMIAAQDARKLNEVLISAIGVSESLYDVVCRRIGKSAPESSDELLEQITFSDLVALARRTALIQDTRVTEALDRMVPRRNDIAHLRALSFDELYELSRWAEVVLSALSVPVVTVEIANAVTGS